MTNTISPDKAHSQHYIRLKDELSNRLYWAAMVRKQPEPEDLAEAFVFVGQYRQTYGYERRNCRLERVCLSIETILAICLPGWITHRDGVHESALGPLLRAQDTAA